MLPLPTDAMLILPGLTLAWAMNSRTVLAGTDGFTSMTNGKRSMLATGTMSRMKLKLRLSYNAALDALIEVTKSSV